MAYTIKEIDNLCKSKATSVFHCNIRSINKNVDLLSALLSQHAHSFSVIATTETWLRKSEVISLPGYITESNARDSRSRGGGVALFVKDNVSYCKVAAATYSCNDIESLFIRLEHDVIIGAVYHPPNGSLVGFLDKLESIFCTVSKHRNEPVIIVGDMNINTYNMTNRDYSYLLQSYNYRNLRHRRV